MFFNHSLYCIFLKILYHELKNSYLSLLSKCLTYSFIWGRFIHNGDDKMLASLLYPIKYLNEPFSSYESILLFFEYLLYQYQLNICVYEMHFCKYHIFWKSRYFLSFFIPYKDKKDKTFSDEFFALQYLVFF